MRSTRYENAKLSLADSIQFVSAGLFDSKNPMIRCGPFIGQRKHEIVRVGSVRFRSKSGGGLDAWECRPAGELRTLRNAVRYVRCICIHHVYMQENHRIYYDSNGRMPCTYGTRYCYKHYEVVLFIFLFYHINP